MDGTELVACADLDSNLVRSYAEAYGIALGYVYEDYGELIEEVEPRIVSVCTPEPIHAPIVIDVTRTNVPAAIHCEKITADTWGGASGWPTPARAGGSGSALTTSAASGRPSRTRGPPRGGSDRRLERMEHSFADLFTYGTHRIDTVGLFNDDRPADWVLGRIDYPKLDLRRGVPQKRQAFTTREYDDGVYGPASSDPGWGFVGAYGRLLGTERESGSTSRPTRASRTTQTGGTPSMCTRRAGTGSSGRSTPRRAPGKGRSARCSTRSRRRRSPLGTHDARNTTEVIFGIYESSRRRGRIELPLNVYDHPLSAMVEAGQQPPGGRADERPP